MEDDNGNFKPEKRAGLTDQVKYFGARLIDKLGFGTRPYRGPDGRLTLEEQLRSAGLPSADVHQRVPTTRDQVFINEANQATQNIQDLATRLKRNGGEIDQAIIDELTAQGRIKEAEECRQRVQAMDNPPPSFLSRLKAYFKKPK